MDAATLSPEIQGRPNIANVQFVDADAADDEIGVSFDVTSRWTVTGNPKDRSMVRLLSYMLENEESMTPRSSAMEWVRRTYSDPAYADPEIAKALAKVLRNDSHEGVRIRAVETLTTLPPAVATQDPRRTDRRTEERSESRCPFEGGRGAASRWPAAAKCSTPPWSTRCGRRPRRMTRTSTSASKRPKR